LLLENNELIMLDTGAYSNGSSTASSIVVSNGNVYVFGHVSSLRFQNSEDQLFWKNGVVTNLSEAFKTYNNYAYISDYLINGNDVYFLGYTTDSANSQTHLVLWKTIFQQ